MLGTFKVHAGDFKPKSGGSLQMGILTLTPVGKFFSERISVSQVESVEIMTEESGKRFFRSAGMGVVGGLALGPVGLLAGLLSGGKKTDVTFACVLKDGRKFLATADSKTYQKFAAAAF